MESSAFYRSYSIPCRDSRGCGVRRGGIAETLGRLFLTFVGISRYAYLCTQRFLLGRIRTCIKRLSWRGFSPNRTGPEHTGFGSNIGRGCVARRLRIDLDGYDLDIRPPRALPAARFERNDIKAPKGVNGRNSGNTLIQKLLDWEPSTSLRSGVGKTYRWIRDEMKAKARVCFRNSQASTPN